MYATGITPWGTTRASHHLLSIISARLELCIMKQQQQQQQEVLPTLLLAGLQISTLRCWSAL
jgi:hypothetical protein